MEIKMSFENILKIKGKKWSMKKYTANNSSYGINQYLEACLGVVYFKMKYFVPFLEETLI